MESVDFYYLFSDSISLPDEEEAQETEDDSEGEGDVSQIRDGTVDASEARLSTIDVGTSAVAIDKDELELEIRCMLSQWSMYADKMKGIMMESVS